MSEIRRNNAEYDVREPTILIIDDDPNNLAIVTGYLGESNFTILVAEDGESGIERADFTRPDLILLDVMMPGIDGYETCKRLKGLAGTKEIPVIFMTALAETEHKVRGFEAGAVDYITKPFQREEVLARVGVHLRIRELTINLQEANLSLERRVEDRTLELESANKELQVEIGQRKCAEGELRKLNRTLRMLSECNQTLIRGADENMLLQDVCGIIVDFGGYQMAWVGYAEAGGEKNVRPVAFAGHEDGYLSLSKMSWGDNEFGRGPTGKAIRNRESVFANDISAESEFEPWRTEALKRNYRSSAAIPLINDGRILGTINLYADKPNAFEPEEIKLLTELADDLAYGIISLRTREEHRKAEEEILKLNEELERRVEARTFELEQANKQLESFTFSVSHDLRAPLRAIEGYVRILLDEFLPQLPDDGKNFLVRISSNVKRMGTLIDDLLEFARFGREPLTKQQVVTMDLLREALEELQSEQEGRFIEMVVGDIPDCMADPQLLRQVFLNLFSNALKYTRKRETARIEFGAFQQEGKTVYFIKDNGAGFDMEYADKLFGVFQRLHDRKEFEGTGVGLAIVRNIISRHGGHIWAEAELDKGAAFYFTVE